MEKYLSYEIGDFLVDEQFVNWVLVPDKAHDSYWQNVFIQYPEVEPIAAEARKTLLNIRIKPNPTMPVGMREELIANIVDHIDRSTLTGRRKPQMSARFGRWAAVACVLLTISFAVYRFATSPAQSSPDLVILKKHNGQGTQKVSNTSGIPLLVLLPDKSTVILEPNSYLVYNEGDFGRQRRLYLSGEAFFEVERQEPHVPFVVNTDHITTQVLGTSFRVMASGEQSAYRVTVSTGLVEVKSKETVLHVAANEEAVFEVAKSQLSQETMLEHAPLSQEAVEEIFDFQAAPLDSVVTTLAAKYKVSISISNPDLAKRTITASLGELHLYEKLELISKATEAIYTLNDGKIIITPNENQ